VVVLVIDKLLKSAVRDLVFMAAPNLERMALELKLNMLFITTAKVVF
jgi:hypothetical protein